MKFWASRIRERLSATITCKMNTTELDCALRSDPYTKKHYGGTFALDRLPEHLSPNQLFILNLSPSGHEGSHWTQISTIDGLTYFDSFGRPPPLEIVPKLLTAGQTVYWSDQVIQSLISQVCGYHVLMVSFLQARGYNLREILTNFYHSDDEDYLRNDAYALRVISLLTTLKERPLIDWSNFLEK